MPRSLLILIALTSSYAWAQSPTPSPTDAHAVMERALEAQAELPATPPALPTTASPSAEDALQHDAFGANGAAAREAHALAVEHALRDSSNAKADAHAVTRPNGAATTRAGDAAQAAAQKRRTTDAKKAVRAGAPIPPHH